MNAHTREPAHFLSHFSNVCTKLGVWPPLSCTPRRSPTPSPPLPGNWRSSRSPAPNSPPCAPRTAATRRRSAARANAAGSVTGCTTRRTNPAPSARCSPPPPGPPATAWPADCRRTTSSASTWTSSTAWTAWRPSPRWRASTASPSRPPSRSSPPAAAATCGSPGTRKPPSRTRSAGRAPPPGPGIDVRGHGGYLVGPGSVTNAGRYLLDTGSPGLPAAPVPARLLRLLTLPPPALPRRPVPRHSLALVQFVRDSPPGRRNSRLYWAACRAYESGSGDALAPALIEAATRTGLSRQEAAATVASAARQAAL
ncbi:hypothetical protein M2266_003518 [Streptomyces sp. SPB162]|nr:hypothetical protein [Streptomyces sp. SPB162]